jgi:hypothetical protein
MEFRWRKWYRHGDRRRCVGHWWFVDLIDRYCVGNWRLEWECEYSSGFVMECDRRLLGHWNFLGDWEWCWIWIEWLGLQRNRESYSCAHWVGEWQFLDGYRRSNYCHNKLGLQWHSHRKNHHKLWRLGDRWMGHRLHDLDTDRWKLDRDRNFWCQPDHQLWTRNLQDHYRNRHRHRCLEHCHSKLNNIHSSECDSPSTKPNICHWLYKLDVEHREYVSGTKILNVASRKRERETIMSTR